MYNQPPSPGFLSIPPCPECRGQRVRATLARSEWESVKLFTGQQGFKLLVCTVCGYTSLYAGDVSALRSEIQKHPDKFEY